MNGQNGKNGDKQGKMKRSNEGQSKYLMQNGPKTTTN